MSAFLGEGWEGVRACAEFRVVVTGPGFKLRSVWAQSYAWSITTFSYVKAICWAVKLGDAILDQKGMIWRLILKCSLYFPIKKKNKWSRYKIWNIEKSRKKTVTRGSATDCQLYLSVQRLIAFSPQFSWARCLLDHARRRKDKYLITVTKLSLSFIKACIVRRWEGAWQLQRSSAWISLRERTCEVLSAAKNEFSWSPPAAAFKPASLVPGGYQAKDWVWRRHQHPPFLPVGRPL